MTRIAQADYGLLSTMDWAKEDPADALLLGPEAPFYLSFVFQSLDLPQAGRRSLEVAWTRGGRPWKEEAGALLAKALLDEKEYGRAIETARAVLALRPAPGPAVAGRAQRTLAEALYWNRDDELALAEAVTLGGGDAEALLFHAVSSLRLNRPEARELLLALFLREKVSSLHGRVYSYLASEPAFLVQFSGIEQDLLEAKYHFVQGSWAKGIPLMERALGGMASSRLEGSTVIAELGNSYSYSGRQAAGARFMEALSARLEGAPRADALEQAGKLYRRAKEYQKALALLRMASEQTRLTAQADRARWFALDILFTLEPADLIEQVASESARWNAPSYFSDLLEERIADLVAASDWGQLARLWKALEANGPENVEAQLCYILARARQEGLTARLPALLPGNSPGSPRDFFSEAARRSPSGYYGMMAAAMLGEIPAQTTPRPDPSESSSPPDSASPADPLDASIERLDAVTAGFLAYGLGAQGYRRLWDQRAKLPDALIVEAVRKLNGVREYRGSLYLAGYLRQRRGLTASEQQLYYPRAFSAQIDALAMKVGVADHILYALIREESYFDPGAVSSAGAVGLSQLMPATAAQVAKSLRIEEPDLRDPVTNLEIGARHLKDLLRSVDSVPKALLAYNAGLTRVRTWEKAGKGLPLDLFLESVPIEETRQYVRKILVSAVMYARLYSGKDPRETAAAFFGLSARPLDEPRPAPAPRAAQPE
ncbi:MAG: lytic transglycosylase domain-containing protein [Acidobacteria bacterium]|nr:lytic transglycosylase domain-containing protein [Acidobacteriota bacterium]